MAKNFKWQTSKYLIDWNRRISKPQDKVTDFLRQFWVTNVVLQEARIPHTLLRVDLVNVTTGVCVEVSPDEYHVHYNPFLHGDREGFLKKIQNDEKKRNILENAGYTLVELYNEDINNLSVELFRDKFGIYL